MARIPGAGKSLAELFTEYCVTAPTNEVQSLLGLGEIFVHRNGP